MNTPTSCSPRQGTDSNNTNVFFSRYNYHYYYNNDRNAMSTNKVNNKFISSTTIMILYAIVLFLFNYVFLVTRYQTIQSCNNICPTTTTTTAQSFADVMVQPYSPDDDESGNYSDNIKEGVEIVSGEIYDPEDVSSRQNNEQRPSEIMDATTIDPTKLIPNSMKSLVAGMGRTTRESFAQKYDMGVGIDPSYDTNQDVLILYGSDDALPNNYSISKSISSGDEGSNNDTMHSNAIPLYDDADFAMENCDEMKIIFTSPKPDPNKPNQPQNIKHKHCIAIMGQWDSYHIQKWKRKPIGRTNESSSIRKMSTEKTTTGSITTELVASQVHHNAKPPSKELTKACNDALHSYLGVYEDAQNKLRPIAEAAASTSALDGKGQRRPIIVMVANYGQSQFFVNFICSARSRDIDLSNILLFATDLPTYQLAQSMSVHVFYDERIFGSIPSSAAKDYRDSNYGKIMMSKVYCVHLINSMGYDLLFQDLDIVWYRDPVSYIVDRAAMEDFDMYLQHDGPHHPEHYRPLAANTGFYYVKHNERTEYFFSVFIRMGELVLDDHSHQAAFTTLANEHVSLRGLRVKVLANDDSKLFLSGFRYHNNNRLLRPYALAINKPYLFHANWLPGNMKQPVLQDTGNWFVQSNCTSSNNNNNVLEDCCLTNPMKPIKGFRKKRSKKIAVD